MKEKKSIKLFFVYVKRGVVRPLARMATDYSLWNGAQISLHNTCKYVRQLHALAFLHQTLLYLVIAIVCVTAFSCI